MSEYLNYEGVEAEEQRCYVNGRGVRYSFILEGPLLAVHPPPHVACGLLPSHAFPLQKAKLCGHEPWDGKLWAALPFFAMHLTSHHSQVITRGHCQWSRLATPYYVRIPIVPDIDVSVSSCG